MTYRERFHQTMAKLPPPPVPVFPKFQGTLLNTATKPVDQLARKVPNPHGNYKWACTDCGVVYLTKEGAQACAETDAWERTPSAFRNYTPGY